MLQLRLLVEYHQKQDGRSSIQVGRAAGADIASTFEIAVADKIPLVDASMGNEPIDRIVVHPNLCAVSQVLDSHIVGVVGLFAEEHAKHLSGFPIKPSFVPVWQHELG